MYRNSVRSGGALLWFLQRITGIYLAVVLFVHILFLHGLLEGLLATHLCRGLGGGPDREKHRDHQDGQENDQQCKAAPL